MSGLPTTRRQLLQRTAVGFGSLALAGLCAGETRVQAAADPLAPRQPLFPAQARQIGRAHV